MTEDFRSSYTNTNMKNSAAKEERQREQRQGLLINQLFSEVLPCGKNLVKAKGCLQLWPSKFIATDVPRESGRRRVARSELK